MERIDIPQDVGAGGEPTLEDCDYVLVEDGRTDRRVKRHTGEASLRDEVGETHCDD